MHTPVWNKTNVGTFRWTIHWEYFSFHSIETGCKNEDGLLQQPGNSSKLTCWLSYIHFVLALTSSNIRIKS